MIHAGLHSGNNVMHVFGAQLVDGVIPLSAQTPGGTKLEG